MVRTKRWYTLTDSGEVVIRSLVVEDYDAVTALINEGYGKRSRESIEWSLRKSPIFRKEFSAVAEVEGKVIGCWLTTVQDLKVAVDLTVPAASGLIVVHPEFRRRGIGKSLFTWYRTHVSTKAGNLLGFGVASSRTRRSFWSRISTSHALPDRAAIYTKTISLRPFEKASKAVSSRKDNSSNWKAKGRWPLSIALTLTGFPAFAIKVDPESIRVCTELEGDMTITGEIRSPKLSSVVLALVRRRLKISGLRHFWKLLVCFRVLNHFWMSIGEV